MTDTTAARRTKRRYAHELYPHAEEGQIRPLTVEVPYLYARAIGMQVWDTSWFDMRGGDAGQVASQRMLLLLEARQRALLADALLQGMSGDEAWGWAAERAWDETGELVSDRADHYGIPFDDIKPYLCGPEPEYHSHWTEPDEHGNRLGHRVDGKESECPDCTEDTPHVLIVDRVEPSGVVRWRIECPGITDACRAWTECTDCTPADQTRLDEGATEAHGAHHTPIADLDAYCVPNGECLLADPAASDEAIHELGITTPGRYDVESFDFTERGEAQLTVQRETAPR